jgi:hypothetical protein
MFMPIDFMGIGKERGIDNKKRVENRGGFKITELTERPLKRKLNDFNALPYALCQ